MCGIVGYVGEKEAAPLLQRGLKRLEYRGYDSAGLAIVSGGAVSVLRSVGKLANLEARLAGGSPKGSVGLGHTRWATHGRPSEENAHPHTDCGGKLAVVHNGIIENHSRLRISLERKGHAFRSQTDTEVIAHLIEEWLARLKLEAPPSTPEARKAALLEAVRRSLNELEGSYALGIVSSEFPGGMLTAKTGSPLVIGLGDGETFVASDVPAFLEHTRDVLLLDDGELALLGPGERAVFRLDGRRVEKSPTRIPWDARMAEKGGYSHFMLKEIHEQPDALENTLRGRLEPLNDGVLEREAGLPRQLLRELTDIHIVACGTSYHAGLVGKYLLEKFCRVPVQVETAAEFRYRDPILTPSTLVLAISQSGETADTLAAVRMARESGSKVLSICNTVGAAIPRASDFTLYTRCGPECGVASTKAFIGQLGALLSLTLHASIARGRLELEEGKLWAERLHRLPDQLHEALALEGRVAELAGQFARSEHFLFLGRTLNYPTALEGALKLKEISYIHAEGYAAGEMKHGPIALIDASMPVVAIATRSPVFEKVLSNIEEAGARGARLIAVCGRGETRLDGKPIERLEVPDVEDALSPIVNIVPLQLLAYHIALLRGCDVDQPRNLAKSVTVE